MIWEVLKLISITGIFKDGMISERVTRREPIDIDLSLDDISFTI